MKTSKNKSNPHKQNKSTKHKDRSLKHRSSSNNQ